LEIPSDRSVPKAPKNKIAQSKITIAAKSLSLGFLNALLKKITCIYILFTSFLQLRTPSMRTFGYAKPKYLFYETFENVVHPDDAFNANYRLADVRPEYF
jgi:hypothetical protein